MPGCIQTASIYKRHRNALLKPFDCNGGAYEVSSTESMQPYGRGLFLSARVHERCMWVLRTRIGDEIGTLKED